MSQESAAEEPTTGVEPRLSPLDAEHRALGATMTPFAGWSMPLRYTSDIAEHHAVRRTAGLFDLSHMGEIAVRGPQAGRALDVALVGRLSALPVGRARYTMLCAEDGGVLDDLVVYRTGEHAWLVVANAANADVVLTELSLRCQGLAVELADDSDMALVAVQGPLAEEILTAVVDEADRAALRDLRGYACTTATVAGATALVARTGYTGEDGFEVFTRPDRAAETWRALLAAGTPSGLVPAGLAARDSLRLEAGMPLYGHELDRSTTPHDAGLGRVVKLDKTDDDGAPLDFVGRAALEERADAEPQRVLVGLHGLGRRAARHGHPVLGPDGAVVGEVTSGAPSPTLGHPIAMAYVRPEVAADGTELTADVRGRHEPVRVVPLPFYRRSTS